jgi:hypothetical protein
MNDHSEVWLSQRRDDVTWPASARSVRLTRLDPHARLQVRTYSRCLTYGQSVGPTAVLVLYITITVSTVG